MNKLREKDVMSSEKMKAIIFDEPNGPYVLKLGEAEKPAPKGNELLVKVNAAGINRADTLQRMGKYPPPEGASKILGLEIAGIVEETGASIKKWKVGDKVFGLIPGGGYAEYAVINQDMAMPVPEGMGMTEAVAIPEVFLTAYQALIWYGKLKTNETALIHAGGSGVGTAGIQIAREIGAHVIITASEGKHKACLELGAEKAIDYKKEKFSEEVLRHTDNRGADVVVDFIAGPYFKQ